MKRQSEILAGINMIREQGRRCLPDISFAERVEIYDIEAALDNLEHRLQSGRDGATETLLAQAEQLAMRLLEIVQQVAA